MPNADSSDRTRFLRLKAVSNDTLFDTASQRFVVDQTKFRATSPDGALPGAVRYVLNNFLPSLSDGTHSIAAAQHASARRPKGF